MKSGLLTPQGNFSADTWVKVYENTLGVAATSVTISGLDGDTDVMYRLVTRIVMNADTNIAIRFNNDSGNNYGRQFVRGKNVTVDAARATANVSGYFNWNSIVSGIAQAEHIINAKSGYLRTWLHYFAGEISGTTVTDVILNGGVWSDTINNITSLVILTDAANGLGVGTFISLWKPLAKV